MEEKTILIQEYIESAQDWRHRDSMLWSTFSLVVALAGASFAYVFGNSSTLTGQLFVLFFCMILIFLALLKITKDHYYQKGSEIYSKHLVRLMTEQELDSILGIDIGENKSFHPRIHSEADLLSLPFYPLLIGISAFKFFYLSNLTLLFIVVCLFGYKLMGLINA